MTIIHREAVETEMRQDRSYRYEQQVEEFAFRRMADHVPQAMWLADSRGEIDWTNKQWDQVVGLQFRAWLEELAFPLRQAWNDAFVSGKPFEIRLPLENGQRWVILRGNPLPETDRWLGTATDISSEMALEHSCTQVEDRLQRVLETSGKAFWDWNLLTGELFWSERLVEILGHRPPLGLASETLDFFRPLLPVDQWQHIAAQAEQGITQKRPFQAHFKLRHLDGHPISCILKGRPYFNSDGQLFRVAGVIRDITSEQQKAERLAEKESLFHSLASSSPVALWLANEGGDIVYVNKTWLDWTGEPLESHLGQGWQQMVIPDDRELVKSHFQANFEQRGYFSEEFRVQRHDGKIRWCVASGTPRFNADGEFLGYAGFCVDFTERKQTQDNLKRYARRLEQSNRELEQFATIASHDLQEPLRKIYMFSEILSAAARDDQTAYLDRIQSASVRMRALIDDLLTLSRIQRKGKPFQPTDLNGVLREVLDDLQVAVQETGAIIETMPLATLSVDARQIEQLLQNLLGNALKYRRDDVLPRIRVMGEHMQESREYRITVEDNGLGIQPEYFSRIFEPFQRLHGIGKYQGTGMGLSICKKIIERHNGTITVESKPDQGTRFYVTLPCVQENLY